MKKTNPLLLWTILWVLGMFFITFKNRVVAGNGIEFGEIIFANIIMDIIVIPVAIIGYFILKFILNIVGAKKIIEGKDNLKNVSIVWFVLFILIFIFPLFKK